MKTERDYGRAYAEAMRGEDGFDAPVDVEDALGRSVSIPPDDYRRMVADGIENPDDREYWEGFNEAFVS